LSELAHKRIRNHGDVLQKYLKGLIGPHQRYLLQAQLNHIEYLEKLIESLDEEIKRRLYDCEKEMELLESIPGVGRRTSEHILAEIGVDMEGFGSAS
jgi:transposase